MSKYYHLIVILLSFYFVLCNKNFTPLEIEQEVDPPFSVNSEGLEIAFSDTCSYRFVLNFLSGFDSISISHTFLGNTYHFIADSGDSEYWLGYFENDSTIQFLGINDKNDSLQLKIRVTGERSSHDELERFSNINYLTLIEVEGPLNLIYINVPEDTESEWKKIFSQYRFILHVNIIGVVFS